MGRGSSQEKAGEWTRRLRRFEKTDQTVAAFCEGEGVSAPSFYWWRRRLRPRTRPTRPKSFRPVHVTTSTAETGSTTVIELGKGVRIQLGSDLLVVESVVKQVLAAALENDSAGEAGC